MAVLGGGLIGRSWTALSLAAGKSVPVFDPDPSTEAECPPRSRVATVQDIDTAVATGPGQRWAVMGPTTLFHLGADEGGLATFCERYAESFHRWWDDLGMPRLDDATVHRLVEGVSPVTPDSDLTELSARRDAMLTSVLAATRRWREAPPGR